MLASAKRIHRFIGLCYSLFVVAFVKPSLKKECQMAKHATRIFLTGMGRVLDLGATSSSSTFKKIKSRNSVSTSWKLFSDWMLIGEDLRKATQSLHSELSPNQRRRVLFPAGPASSSPDKMKLKTQASSQVKRTIEPFSRRPCRLKDNGNIEARTEARQCRIHAVLVSMMREHFRRLASDVGTNRETEDNAWTERDAGLQELRTLLCETKGDRVPLKRSQGQEHPAGERIDE